MNNKSAYFEKYSVAPSPSRDYYGLKVFHGEVILYIWKISYGPHLFPIVRVIKFSEFNGDKLLKEEILHVFGSNVLKYLEIVTSEGAKTLLTLPKCLIETLIKYLSLEDFVKLTCVSPISEEIFNINSFWEILYKRLKGSSYLSEMERELGANSGFKKLVKDHHIRNAAKKTLKAMEEKPVGAPKATVRKEKVLRSSTLNLPKVSLLSEVKSLTRKLSIDDNVKKVIKPTKPSIKAYSMVKEKKFNFPKKTSSDEKSSIAISSHGMHEKRAVGEFYRNLKLPQEITARRKSEIKIDKNGKSKITNEEKLKNEILTQSRYFKSACAQTNASDAGSEELKIKSIRSPRSIFTKYSNLDSAEFKQKPDDSPLHQRKSKESKTKLSAQGRIDLKSLISDRKTDELDDSGMSYLMKRYLQASDEVTRKFTDCDRLTRFSKNTSTQADLKDKLERKPGKKQLKNSIGAERPLGRNPGSSTNIFEKMQTYKKTNISHK